MSSQPTFRSALRAWSLGPLPVAVPEERWSLPDGVEAPDDERYTRRRGRAGAVALLVALTGALGFSLAWSDPWSLGWNARVAGVTARLDPWVDRAVAAAAASLR